MRIFLLPPLGGEREKLKSRGKLVCISKEYNSSCREFSAPMPSHRPFSFCPDLGASFWPCIAIVGCFLVRSKIWQSQLRNCTHNMSFDLQSIFHSLDIRPQMKIIVATISLLARGLLESAQGRKVVRQDGKKQKHGGESFTGEPKKESLPVSVTRTMPHDQELETPFS